MTKPRIRVKAGSVPALPVLVPAPPARPTARWLRDAPSGALSMRSASLVESREDTRRAWGRIAALAVDFIQNSGRLKGAVDQIVADTVGNELKLRAKPDLSALGYSPAETTAFARLVEERWRRYAWNAAEVDFRGKFVLPQLLDIGLRHHVAYGEALALTEFMSMAERRRYGISTGSKLLLVTPTRLVPDTNEIEGLFSGVVHDANGRPVAYRLQHRESGISVKRDHATRDRAGRQLVTHVFDPWDGSDVRGVSMIAAAMRTHAHAERLHDATLATAILQTVFAATLTSPEPSAEAFQAIEALDSQSDSEKALKDDFLGYFENALDTAKKSTIALNDPLDGSSQVSHLAPGEKLSLHTAATPGSTYLPFSADLRREMARCLGITAASFTLDYNGATYSSTRMETSSLWPLNLRRRERICAPIAQAGYESWLDEEIGEGRIPLRGGHAAFMAHRDAICWAEWQGPAKPTADDLKSAKAASERLQNGTTTLEYECAELGLDSNDVIAKRAEEAATLAEKGLPSPFARVQGGGGRDDPYENEEDEDDLARRRAKERT